MTAIGDSVMLDYADELRALLPGVAIHAAVGLQFSAGISLAERLRAEHRLGSVVVVALGTNGPVTPTELRELLAVLRRVRRVVLVTVHVDRPWQDSVNAVLRAGAAVARNAVVADWAALAAHHPGWFYADGTHLPIDGPGARALARLIAAKVHAASPGASAGPKRGRRARTPASAGPSRR